MYDFDSIVNRIYQNLSNKEKHKDLFNTAVYRNLIESIAQELEFYHTASGYRTRENQWSLAQNKSSLLSQSEVHNYQPSRKISSRGFVKFGVSENFDTTPDKIVNIPKYTQFSNTSGDLSFSALTNYQLTTGDTSVNVEVIQGVFQSNKFTAIGEKFEEITIDNGNIEDTSVEVYVNDLLYGSVETLLDYTGDDLICFISNKIDFSGITIQFGNGSFGRQLQNGDKIVINYILSDGKDGNVSSKNIVDTVDSVIYDIEAQEVDDVFVTNTEEIVGGGSETTLEEIRVQSPKRFQTGDRAITKEDYISILEDLSYIKKSNVWGAYEYNIDNGLDPWTYIEPEENVTHVALITEANENILESQKNQILEDINAKKSPTNLLFFETVDFVNMIFNVDAYVINSSYALPNVKGDIESTLANTYSLDNIQFEQNLYESDYKRLIDSIKGVKYHNTYIELYKDLEFSSPYASDVFLPVFPVKSLSLKLYIKLKSESEYNLIGTGDGSGNFIAESESGYVLTDSSINLSSGTGSIIVNSGLTDGSVAEVTSVETIADVAGSLNSTYFNIYNGSSIFYVWYNVDSTGTDPDHGGTGIPVTISEGDTAETIASATQVAVNDNANFEASVDGDNASKVIITAGIKGDSTDSVDGNTGFTIETVVDGQDAIRTYEDYDIRLIYQSNNSNLLLNNRQDIFRYGYSNITIQYFSG